MERYLSLPQVRKLTTLSSSTIYRLTKEDEFPKPRSLSNRRKAWLESDIKKWIKQRGGSDGIN